MDTYFRKATKKRHYLKRAKDDMTKKNIITLTEGSSFIRDQCAIVVTRHQNPNAQATLIMSMAIDTVRLATAGFSQVLTVSAIVVVCNFELNAVKVKWQ